MQWLHHQSELGGDTCSLRLLVSWFRSKLSVKFRHHQTSYLSHVLNAVNMKSPFDIYFICRKTQLNITSYTCSELNRKIQIFRSIGKCQVHKAHLVKCWLCIIEFSSKYFVSPPSPNRNQDQHIHCTYNVVFFAFLCVCRLSFKACKTHAQYYNAIFGLSGCNIFFHIIS